MEMRIVLLVLLLFSNWQDANCENEGSLLLEPPLLFEVPLPSECTVAGTHSRTYNQGQCSRDPCRTVDGECSHSNNCCYEVGQTAQVKFSCSESKNTLEGSVIVMCQCQPCEKLHTRIRGRLLSSKDKAPIVLAAVMIGNEIATFTDQEGWFFFILSTSERQVNLLFQEASHTQLEVTVNTHSLSNHEFTIVLEYIEAVHSMQKTHLSFEVQLTEKDNDIGVEAFLHFPPNALVLVDFNEDYTGPAKVLHSLYHMSNKPDFSAPAVHQMVYKDSKRFEYAIKALLIGSLRVVDEGGNPLALRPGTPLPLTVSLKFDKKLSTIDTDKLHLFVFSEADQRWMDYGRLTVLQNKPLSDELGCWVTVQGKLRELSPFWAIGAPGRITCHVKVRAFQNQQKQELVGLKVNLEQIDDSLGRTTFYQHTLPTTAGSGVCLKSVCELGGLLEPQPEGGMKLWAPSPDVENGITMGDREQIVFYKAWNLNADGSTPYYITETACRRGLDHKSGFFLFLTNSSIAPLPQPPSLLPLLPPTEQSDHDDQFCFVKVSVYDCAPYSEVKVLSYGAKEELLSLNTDVATSAHTGFDSCVEGVGAAQLRATCVQVSCGSKLHITVQSRSKDGQTKDCRYWSSSPALVGAVPSALDLTVFELKQSEHSTGIYRAASMDLAQLKCLSGSESEPGNTMDPYRGTTVTFTCQF